jgi:hypothetical protein
MPNITPRKIIVATYLILTNIVLHKINNENYEPLELFYHNNYSITNPFYDITLHYIVNPFTYYENSFIEWLTNL